MPHEQGTMAHFRLNESFDGHAKDIKDERLRQIDKWGDEPYSADKFCRVLGEEFGEVCDAVQTASECYGKSYEAYENSLLALRNELVQVAAVAVRFMQQVDREIEEHTNRLKLT